MSDPRTVAIAGLGLIGGSMARRFHANGMRVTAYDRDGDAIDAAIAAGVVDVGLDETLNGCTEAQVVVIALPGGAARGMISRLHPLPGNVEIVMDVGSAKLLVVEGAESAGIGSRFVGTHPLAGDHRSGWESSRDDLFDGHRVFVCPAESTTPETLRAARDLWISLGALPEVTDASTHDAQMAWVSHLPHVVASALAMTLREAGVSRSVLGPGGRDMTRLAGGSPEMWTSIVAENASAIDAALAAFERNLGAMRHSIAAGDGELFAAQFASGRDWFNAS